jgi:hypothetical protein
MGRLFHSERSEGSVQAEAGQAAVHGHLAQGDPLRWDHEAEEAQEGEEGEVNETLQAFIPMIGFVVGALTVALVIRITRRK